MVPPVLRCPCSRLPVLNFGVSCSERSFVPSFCCEYVGIKIPVRSSLSDPPPRWRCHSLESGAAAVSQLCVLWRRLCLQHRPAFGYSTVAWSYLFACSQQPSCALRVSVAYPLFLFASAVVVRVALLGMRLAQVVDIGRVGDITAVNTRVRASVEGRVEKGGKAEQIR